jgi:CheY-like chemotaxis protein
MKRILIIEDDPIIAQIYRTQLQNGTFSVEICNDGQTGFERIHEVHPDAILLDLMLPRMNGLEILKQIRAQSQFAAVPIVVLTNAYLPNTIQEAAAAGATHIHDKATLKPRQILESLHLLLECEEDEPSANGPASSRQVPSPPPPPPAAKNIITPSQPWGSGSDQPGSPPPAITVTTPIARRLPPPRSSEQMQMIWHPTLSCIGLSSRPSRKRSRTCATFSNVCIRPPRKPPADRIYSNSMARSTL